MSAEYTQEEYDRLEAEAFAAACANDNSHYDEHPYNRRREAETIQTDGRTIADLAADYGIVCPADYENEDVPDRAWWIEGLVPVGQVTLLYGDGGVGKSLLALQWGMAGAAGIETLGMSPAKGPVFLLGAEDEEDEFKRRQVDICRTLGVYLNEVDQFHLWPLAGEDAVMALPDASKRMVATAVFRKVEAFTRVLRPRCIILDTAADLFGGSEIDRSQVRQFVGMLRRLAIELQCAVILLAHPSVSGMMSGNGTSGSTGWSNSARSRLYLTRPDGKDDDDPDARLLKTMKSNYGKIGGETQIRWERGAFVTSAGSQSKLMAEAKAERVFMDCLHAVDLSMDRVTLAKTSPAYYAPKVFAAMPEADGVNVRQFEKAMSSLLRSGQIKEINHGTTGRPLKGIVDASKVTE